MTLIKFETVPIKESNEPLVDAAKFGLMVEPIYSKQGLSAEKRIFLRKGLVEKLKLIEKDLKIYKFKIWDGYRPREIQNKIFDRYFSELKSKHPNWPEDKLKTETG